MPKVFNKHHGDAPADAVNIMRGSFWGNPVAISETVTRDQAVDSYEARIRDNPDRDEIVAVIRANLKGKNLLCCCAPKRCHGDVLLRIANSEGDPWTEDHKVHGADDVITQLQGIPKTRIERPTKEELEIAYKDLESSCRYLESVTSRELGTEKEVQSQSTKDLHERLNKKRAALSQVAAWLKQECS